MRAYNRNVITILKTEEFLLWLKEVKPDFHEWDMNTLNLYPNAYLVEFEDQNCFGECFKKYYKQIFEYELSDHIPKTHQKYPENLSFEKFSLWFTFKMHEGVVDLSSQELKPTKI